MSIKAVTVYRFQGRDYPTFDKAKDVAETRVAQFLQSQLVSKGFTANEAFKVAVTVIECKAQMLRLLDYPDTDSTTD